MAIKKVTKVYGVDDCKIYPIIQDDKDGFKVGEEIDGVGVKSVSLTFEADEKDLTGDEMTLDTISKVKSMTASSEFAKLSLDTMALFTGGYVKSDENSAMLSIGSSASGNQKYFQLQFQIKTTDNEGGDLHYILFKVKATSTPINGTEDDYATFSVEFKGVFTEHEFAAQEDGQTEKKLAAIKLNAKVTPLAPIVEEPVTVASARSSSSSKLS